MRLRDPLGSRMRALLNTFAPDPDALLDWLRPRLDDTMLDEITAADYGGGYDVNLHILRAVRDDDRVWVGTDYDPLVVLQLISYSQPDTPTWRPGRTGEAGHLMRAFACTLLLRAAAEPETWDYDLATDDTLAQLLRSALVLGRDPQRALLRLLAWLLRWGDRPVPERPPHALAVVLLVVTLGVDRTGGTVRRLCAWAVAEDAWVRASADSVTFDDGRPFGWLDWDNTHGWRALAWQVLVEPGGAHPAAADDAVLDLVDRLVVGAS